jgi:hypothetical protein
MKERLKTIDPTINLDWEHEFAKDLVYLQEEMTLLQQELEKQPARIEVIDKDKILNRKHEHQDNVLPF